MHTNIIKYNINKDVNIFDEIIKQIEYEYNKPCHNIQEMKDRANMKRKGDMWEFFCKDWLISTGKYKDVYLLDEFNEIFKHDSKLPKQDNGIDIIAINKSGNYEAIQCKYRSKYNLLVTWKSLSTFIALCERTQNDFNWDSYTVMTNCKGVTRKIKKSPKDKSICLQRLRNTKKDQWLKMIGSDPLKLKVSNSKPKKLTLDELRKKRVDFFC